MTALAGPAAAAVIKCAEGAVQRVDLVGYGPSGPGLRTIVGDKPFTIGMSSSEDATSRMLISEFRTLLMAALMSGMPVELHMNGKCSSIITQTNIDIRVRSTTPSPIDRSTGAASSTDPF